MSMNQPLPFSRRIVLGLLGTLALALAGCGRKASPRAPEDADPRAPRVYPVDRTRRDDSAPPAPPSPDATPPVPPPFSDPLTPVPLPPGYR